MHIKAICELCKVLQLWKLANANINRACFDTEIRRSATLDHAQIQLYRYQQKQKLWATLRITVSSRIPSHQTLYGNFP